MDTERKSLLQHPATSLLRLFLQVIDVPGAHPLLAPALDQGDYGLASSM